MICSNKYDLEDRTLEFAKNCVSLCRFFVRDSINSEFVSQLIRSSGSIGANYREANDTTTRKDFLHRIGICRREAKETKYWLELLMHANPGFTIKMEPLINEALQLTRIFASIVQSRV